MKYIKVYVNDSNLKDRIKNVKGVYSESLFCYQAIEKEVKRLENKKAKEV